MSESEREQISLRCSLDTWERQESSLKAELERWREVERTRVRTEIYASVAQVVLLLGALIGLVSFASGFVIGGWLF